MIFSVNASLHPHRPTSSGSRRAISVELESENSRKKKERKEEELSQWPLRKDRDSIQWLRPELVRQWAGPIRISRERGSEWASGYPTHARRFPRKNGRPTSPSVDLYVECSLSDYVSANDSGHRRLSGGNFAWGNGRGRGTRFPLAFYFNRETQLSARKRKKVRITLAKRSKKNIYYYIIYTIQIKLQSYSSIFGINFQQYLF